MQEQKVEFSLRGRVVTLTIPTLNDDLEVEELIKIDVENLGGEILTFPLVFNRIGNLKAEVNHLLSIAKFNLKSLESELYNFYRDPDYHGGKRVTEKMVESMICADKKFIIANLEYFKLQEKVEMVESLYWSAKSKDSKLEKISDKMSPNEFSRDILEGQVNKIFIKLSKVKNGQ